MNADHVCCWHSHSDEGSAFSSGSGGVGNKGWRQVRCCYCGYHDFVQYEGKLITYPEWIMYDANNSHGNDLCAVRDRCEEENWPLIQCCGRKRGERQGPFIPSQEGDLCFYKPKDGA